ncbi:MAG: transporter substrate-binding domain-containing protein [Eubacteriales bacterium]|nr:transporter substrate-binding domain-containing protein [Eubacteriales bacterium]
MKKMGMLLALAMMGVAVLSGCGKKEETGSSQTGSQTGSASGSQTSSVVKATSVSLQTVKDSGMLKVGTEAGFAPYEFIGDSGDIVGIDIDIAQAIADKLGVKLKIENMTFDGALVGVQQGKVDMVIAGVSVDEDRKKVMDFSDNYVDTKEVVVVNAAEPAVKEATAEGLKDKKVGVQRGNIADLWVSNPDNTAVSEIVRYEKFAQAATDLKNNKIDAIVMDEAPAKELVEATGDALAIIEGEPLFVDQYAVALQKGNTELTAVVNEVIKELKDSGEFDKIVEKYSK